MDLYGRQAISSLSFSIWMRMVNGIQDLARTVRQIPTRYAPVRHFVLNCSTHLSTPGLPIPIRVREGGPELSIWSEAREQRSTCMC